RPQVLQIVLRKPQVPDEVDHPAQATGDGKPAAKRMPAESHVEDRLALGHAQLPITVGHRELVQVREQSQRFVVELERTNHDDLLLGNPLSTSLVLNIHYL